MNNGKKKRRKKKKERRERSEMKVLTVQRSQTLSYVPQFALTASLQPVWPFDMSDFIVSLGF